eukprot:2333742-Amphidinium_carterae.1
MADSTKATRGTLTFLAPPETHGGGVPDKCFHPDSTGLSCSSSSRKDRREWSCQACTEACSPAAIYQRHG